VCQHSLVPFPVAISCLKGAFSRLDFQRNPASSRNAIKSFETALPAAARDVYYRDVIGNVSTSNLRVCLRAQCRLAIMLAQEDDEAVTLLIRPRFPLFGGWKTQYTLGYNLPSYEVLSHSGSQFSLNIRFVVCLVAVLVCHPHARPNLPVPWN
jgi:oligosaccharyltransferase complex subunit alpha (ribophorin I)